MKLFKNSIVSLVVAALLVSASAVAAEAKLHAIIVANTEDRNIGPSDALDMQRIQTLMQTISKNTGLGLNMITFHDSNFARTSIMNAIKNLRPGNDDTVIFYYTGHGYRTPSMRERFPAMALQGNQGLALQWVYNTLRAKQPRLLLVMGDLCNVVVNIQDTIIASRAMADVQREGYRQLFRVAKAHVIVTSSQPGEVSFANNTGGSAFTVQFLRVLNQHISTPNPQWSSFMRDATSPINQGSGRMTPVFAIQDSGGGPIQPPPPDNPLPEPSNDDPVPEPVVNNTDDDATGYGAGMIELETSVRYEAQDASWQSERGGWLMKVKAAGADIRQLSVCLLEFEKGINYEGQEKSWQQKRDAWVRRAQAARNMNELKALLLMLEESILYTSQQPYWQEKRDAWLANINQL